MAESLIRRMYSEIEGCWKFHPKSSIFEFIYCARLPEVFMLLIAW